MMAVDNCDETGTGTGYAKGGEKTPDQSLARRRPVGKPFRLMRLSVVFLAACAATLQAGESPVTFGSPDFSVTTPEGWHVASQAITTHLSNMTRKGVVIHASRAANVTPSDVESKVLLMVSKVPLIAEEDNPNVTVSLEKSWDRKPTNTGATYLELMSERLALFNLPSRFVGKPRLVELGGAPFYSQDAVNKIVPDAPTKQEYLTTYLEGYYISFIISYNDKSDADYKAMRGVAASFAPGPK